MNKADRDSIEPRSVSRRAAGLFRYLAALERAAEFSMVDALQLRVSYLERRLLAVETQLSALRTAERNAIAPERMADRRHAPPRDPVT